MLGRGEAIARLVHFKQTTGWTGFQQAFRHGVRPHLLAAEGWLELGNPEEASQKLEKIEPRLRAHPEVLETPADVRGRAVVGLLPDLGQSALHWRFLLIRGRLRSR